LSSDDAGYFLILSSCVKHQKQCRSRNPCLQMVSLCREWTPLESGLTHPPETVHLRISR